MKRLFANIIIAVMVMTPLTVNAEDLETRVADLEERVAALEAMIGETDGNSKTTEGTSSDEFVVEGNGCILQLVECETAEDKDGRGGIEL